MNNITTTFVDRYGSIVRVSAAFELSSIITISGEIVGKTTGEFKFSPANESQLTVSNLFTEFNDKKANSKDWRRVVRALENIEGEVRSHLPRNSPKFLALLIYLDIPSNANIKPKQSGINTFSIGKGKIMICTANEARSEARSKIEKLIKNHEGHETLAALDLDKYIINISDIEYRAILSECSKIETLYHLIDNDGIDLASFVDDTISEVGYGAVLDLYDGVGGKVNFNGTDYYFFHIT